MATTRSLALDMRTGFVVLFLCATAQLCFGQYDSFGGDNITTPATATEGNGGASTGTPAASEDQHTATEEHDSSLLDEERSTAEIETTTTGSQEPDLDTTTTSGPEIILGEPGLRQVYSLGPINASTELRLDTCGSRGRIIGGLLSTTGAWPWAVVVKDKYGSHYCGGVLISNRHILTAAHCIEHPDLADRLPLKVTVGDYDLSTNEESDSRTEWVHEAFTHNQYNYPTLHNNDIGVLVVQNEIDGGSDVTPVCLPSAQLDLPVGTELFIVGWGATVYKGPVVNELRQVKLTVLDDSRCSAVYNEFKADRMYCVGDLAGGKDACQGDSGGPLLYRDNDGKWYVVGVVSFGSQCGVAEYPGVYSSVPFHLGLINWALQNS